MKVPPSANGLSRKSKVKGSPSSQDTEAHRKTKAGSKTDGAGYFL